MTEGPVLIFCDTETTGLALDDDIWEFAAIRREPDGTESQRWLFIEHDPAKCRQLPDSFLADHLRRWPRVSGHAGPCTGYAPVGLACTRADAARTIHALLADRCHIVGAVPNFDTERIARLLNAHGLEPGWHYHLIDVENLAAGYLARQWRGYTDSPNEEAAAHARLATSLPWDSDELSRAVGVEPMGDERHTAMGDARWARAIYDKIMGGAS